MTYEPGVLVRRQQREYPPELRQEIALTALEVGNNREVARLYSERLGYTVNESTVRGIKKRYLEGVQKGKIDSPGLSPRALVSGGDSSRSSDTEEGNSFQPDQVMKLQLEVLEDNMKDPNGPMSPKSEHMDDSEMTEHSPEVESANRLVINDSILSGEDSRDSSYNQLSIDMGDTDQTETVTTVTNKPTIRVARGLQKSPSASNGSASGLLTSTSILAATLSGAKRKSGIDSSSILTQVFKKARPSAAETEADITSLDKEIRALQWLARRKEQEWDQVIRLLKQKEERLLRAQRCRIMIQTEAEHLLSKYQTPLPALPNSPVVIPQQQVLILPATATTRLIRPKPPMTVTAPIMTKKPTSTASIVTHSPSLSPTRRNSKSPASSQSLSPRQSVVTSTHQQQTPNSISNARVTNSNGDADNVVDDAKLSSMIEKASKNLAIASGAGKDKEAEKKNPPVCQGCGEKKSEFVCAGCSNRWYCSRECQVEDWDEHADDCSG